MCAVALFPRKSLFWSILYSGVMRRSRAGRFSGINLCLFISSSGMDPLCAIRKLREWIEPPRQLTVPTRTPQSMAEPARVKG